MNLEKEKLKQSFGAKVRRLFNYFLKGLIIALPIYATYRIIRTSIEFIDEILKLDIPGLGFIIVMASITFLGFIGSTIITRPITDLLDDVFSNIPLIKTIYLSVKDLIGAFVGDKKKFSKPVIVEFSDGIYKPGFITQEDLSDMNLPGAVAVYMPHSYAFSGNLFFVDRKRIHVFDGSSSNLMKYIVSGGVIEMNNKEEEEEASI